MSTDRRSGLDRRTDALSKRRRAADRFNTVLQRFILAGGSIGAIYGQAELLGEPWRHVVAVGGVAILFGVAIWMKET
jgi:hypothetical protein